MVVSFFGHRRFVERDVNAGEIIAEIEKTKAEKIKGLEK